MRIGGNVRHGLRRAAKQAAAGSLHRTGARIGLSRLRRRSPHGTRVLIVAYHRVVPDFDDLSRRVIPPLLTSTATFEKQLATIERSYRIASLAEALDVLGGRSSTGRDLCVVTFDDAYRDFVEHALPVLRRRGVPATLYVPSAFVSGSAPLLHDRLYLLLQSAKRAGVSSRSFDVAGRVREPLQDALLKEPISAVEELLERWSRPVCIEVAETIESALGKDPAAALEDAPALTWADLRTVQAAGVEIGGHTTDHACLHNESPTGLADQVRGSKAQIERELGVRVLDFSYPNGWYSQSAIGALQAAGYRSAVTTEDRLNGPREHPFALKRKVVWENTSRGLRGFSPAVAACNFDNVFAVAGLSRRITGEKPDPVARALS